MAKTKEDAAMAYRHVCADLRQGMSYNVDAQLYNDCLEAIGSSRRVTESVTAEKFTEDFWASWKVLYGK